MFVITNCMKILIDNTGHINTHVKETSSAYMLGTLMDNIDYVVYIIHGTLQNLRIECEHILM